MKNLKMLLAAVVISGAMFTSCSDDDDNNSNMSGDLTARWNPDKEVLQAGNDKITTPYDQNDPECEKNYVEFVDGGMVRVVAFTSPFDECDETEHPTVSTWDRTDDNLTITGHPSYQGTWEIIRLSNTQLRLRQNIGGSTNTTRTLYFRKAANQGN